MPEPPRLTRWKHANPPSLELLEALLADEELEPHWWSNGGGDLYEMHEHAYHKVLYCLDGTVTFVLVPTNERLTLGAGDRLDLPAGWPHRASVGPQGVTCVEGWRKEPRSGDS